MDNNTDTFWKNYQEEAHNFCLEPCWDLSYLILGFNGECSELTEVDASHESEIGGVLWYMSQITKYVGLDLDLMMKDAQKHWVSVLPRIYLNSIAGKIAESYKKVHRGDKELETIIPKLRFNLIWAITLILFIASEYNVTLEEMATANIRELTYRKKHNLIKGDGDYRGAEKEKAIEATIKYPKDQEARKPLVIR